jgi:CHRD domain
MRGPVMAGFLAIAMCACSPESVRTPAQPETITLPLRVESAERATTSVGSGMASVGAPENHRTHLSGGQEPFTPSTPGGPTPADSRAQGQAIFKISKDGDSFDYKLIASNIENVVMAHIHCGAVGINGPIVVWLFPSPTATSPLTGPTGRQDGVLAEGTIVNGTALHVRPTTSPLCPGGVATFDDVLAKMRTGNAYVNVHTNDGVAPTNSGPGDFPGGEIRGQF